MHKHDVDVKFPKFEGKDGTFVNRYQYTAIDDATRIRTLKIHNQHNQSNASASSMPSSTNSFYVFVRRNGQ